MPGDHTLWQPNIVWGCFGLDMISFAVGISNKYPLKDISDEYNELGDNYIRTQHVTYLGHLSNLLVHWCQVEDMLDNNLTTGQEQHPLHCYQLLTIWVSSSIPRANSFCEIHCTNWQPWLVPLGMLNDVAVDKIDRLMLSVQDLPAKMHPTLAWRTMCKFCQKLLAADGR